MKTRDGLCVYWCLSLMSSFALGRLVAWRGAWAAEGSGYLVCEECRCEDTSLYERACLFVY